MKTTEVVLTKGKKDEEKAILAKEDISKVIDSIAPPAQLGGWNSKPPSFKAMEKQYASYAYLEWDSKVKVLVVVTKGCACSCYKRPDIQYGGSC